ncbi:MAG: ParB/RepB/Spo0J family partition protein, partial [Armatimonadetes bacterium]|nr:ParB/RepB/Spo0J family partition protein [Armatimonadota bacterium]
LEELAQSIRSIGVLQPIVVRPLGGGRYQIIAGERRWRAARRAGLTAVPCLVRDMDDREALAAAMVENLQREDLNPIEAARGYRMLQEKFGLTQEQLAEIVGKSRVSVTNTLRLLNLPPEVQAMLLDGRLTEGHGRALLGLSETPTVLKALAKQAAEQGWSVRELEAKVRDVTTPKQAMKHRPPHSADPRPELEQIREELQQALGTLVRIKTRRGDSGVIEIDFYGADDLARIADIICS